MRDADFLGYRATLDALMKWVVALDRTRYARSIPILLRDLSTLEERFPDLYVAFAQNGFFMGQKTKRAFSRIPIDQCNEQLIDWLKNESAVIGNLDDPATIRREQVARPELARMVQEFEGLSGGMEEATKHHEQFPAFQAKFQVCTMNLAYIFPKHCHPFYQWTEIFQGN